MDFYSSSTAQPRRSFSLWRHLRRWLQLRFGWRFVRCSTPIRRHFDRATTNSTTYVTTIGLPLYR